MESLWISKAQGSQFIYFSNSFEPAHKSNWKFAILLGSLWREGSGISWCQPPLCHHWSPSPFQTPPELVPWKQPDRAQNPGWSWWCGASAGHVGPRQAGQTLPNTAKHSSVGKTAGSTTPAIWLLSVSLALCWFLHTGAGEGWAARALFSLKPLSSSTIFGKYFCLLPEVNIFLWVKHSPFSHIPFAINATVVIVILVKLFIHYLKGWGEGSSLLGAVFPVLDKMSTLLFRSLSLLHNQYLLRPLGLKTLEYRKIKALDTIPFTMLLFTITHLHKFVWIHTHKYVFTCTSVIKGTQTKPLLF